MQPFPFLFNQFSLSSCYRGNLGKGEMNDLQEDGLSLSGQLLHMALRPGKAENGRSHQKAGHRQVQDGRINEHFPLWVTTVRQPRKKYRATCQKMQQHVQVFCGLIKRGRAGRKQKVKRDVSLKV